MASRVIVFGPTGNVGSIAARTAQQKGAKVFLAMRDIYKPIPGLSAAEEASRGFERVQADLLQPQSVGAAVRRANATAAFIYLSWGTTDHMEATLEAAKSAGISFLVFLSSFTIKGPIEKVPPSDRIPYNHARVEMSLEEVYGSKNYVALRAGAFATNTGRWRTGISSGELKIDNPGTEYDYITPTDMGRVGGTILAQGQQDGQNIVYLYGPRMLPQSEAIGVVLKALGKRMKVVRANTQGDQIVAKADPQEVVVTLGEDEEKSGWFASAYSNFEEETRNDNIRKYTGQPATEYKTWVEENTSYFTV